MLQCIEISNRSLFQTSEEVFEKYLKMSNLELFEGGNVNKYNHWTNTFRDERKKTNVIPSNF